ncbi:MAG TPA: thioredoxin-like domain-containing protein [Vicinamibacterales bacterium]|jgi:thiol-disulfide isomerase/thioredoxin
MAQHIEIDRRRFLGRAAMTIAAAHLGLFGKPDDASGRESRQLAAFGRASAWINSPALTPAALAGKVVVVDFWTYTCINWMRTLPFIRAWTQRYRQGLVLVGVHTPEFPFEHDLDNVRRSVRQMDIGYPVAVDNDRAIWRAFDNNYWPALYLVDARGRLRQHYFGEGQYDKAETSIQRLLTDAGAPASGEAEVAIRAAGAEAPADWRNLRSSENYVGYERSVNFASPGGGEYDKRHLYAAPPRLALNQWALAGEWTMGRQAVVLSGASGRIAYRFHSRDLHLVMGPPKPGNPVRFRVTLDGQPPRAAHGVDVDEAGNGSLVEPRMYQLIRQQDAIVDRRFEIEFLQAGVEAYSFTFG